MLFGLLSINYLDTPIEIRDLVALSDTRKMELITKLRSFQIHQVVILSTCNRCEVYVVVEDEEQLHKAKICFQDMFTPLDVTTYLNIKDNENAIEYLFEVTSGLHSLVLGEDQILGQVSDALQFSKEMGSCAKQIDKIFREAITSAKKIKTQLKISEHPLSLSYIGIQQLKKVCGIKGKNVLVLGSGKMAELAMLYLYDEEVKHVWNCNRTLANASAMKEKFPQLEICDFAKRYELLEKCDIVISATASPHIILHYHKDQEYANDIYMLDLASPRDIDPLFPHVYNIDSLKEIANEHKQQRLQKTEEAKLILYEDVQTLLTWMKSSSMDQSLHTLQEHIDEVVNDTYAILNRKIDMNERERFILKKTLYASMYRLMKAPIQNLKNVDENQQAQYKYMIEDIFMKRKENDSL